MKLFNPPLWGVSIALSWTWGLGLFFSVQIAIQFGLPGLLCFAIPNAIGLAAFGWFTGWISKRQNSPRDFERHFLTTVGKLRWVFLLYQIIAISLTFFALFKYVFLPLNVPLPMVGLLVLGAGLLLGEQFDIDRIKWTHLAWGLVILLSILLIGWGGASYFRTNMLSDIDIRRYRGVESVLSWKFAGFFVPIIIGFLLGPWLDIQQWQRALRINREKTSVGISYTFGGIIFFGILLFHGTLALAIWGEGVRLGLNLAEPTTTAIFHAKDAVVRFLFLSEGVNAPVLFKVMYVVFLCLCIVATLDSGYVALKWFQSDAVNKSESLLLSLIPKSFLNSPIPPFLLAAAVGLATAPLEVELEYYMAFYGSFLVGYSMVFLFRTVFEPRFTSFTQTTLFALAAFSLGSFGIGYFKEIPVLMMLGSILPLVHAIVCIATRKAVEEIRRSGVMDSLAEGDIAGAVKKVRPQGGGGEKPLAKEAAPETPPMVVESHPDLSPSISSVASQGSAWIEGKWFVYRFMSTYQDTNSVGNVYFAQYGMFVGKTRELFFNHAMPNFDLRTTPFYILTRSYEHKFLKESREFEEIEVKIRISDVNRKFVTMEHNIYNSAKEILGKGKQVLLFVSSKDYKLLDVPAECQRAFLPYL
ncbi:MAG: hypothetical protein RLY93_00120 [Sumerlaeia bacterium]